MTISATALHHYRGLNFDHLDFEVKQGGRTLGTLSVSKGSRQWRSARNHRRKGKAKAGTRIRWSDFADWAEQR